MKNLFLIKPKFDDEGEPIFDDQGKQLKEKEQLSIQVGDQKIPVQIKEFMDTETYFTITLMTDENKAKQMKDQGYLLMKSQIINPKIDDGVINRLPWLDTLKIQKALTEEFMPEDSFLELGLQLDSFLQDKGDIE